MDKILQIPKDKEVKTLILDLDNCLFDSREWIKLAPTNGTREQWDEFHKLFYLAKPNQEMIEFIENLYLKHNLHQIIFITSREDRNNMFNNTLNQILDVSNYSNIWTSIQKQLYLRDEFDYRPACEVKQDILKYIINFRGFYPDLAIDDDINNIDMYKANNIETIHYTRFLD